MILSFIERLEKYHEEGLLLKQHHPTKDLTIWNYSPRVQYDKLWDDVTKACRGLVTNSNGEVVARPFSKFFNYEEMVENEIPLQTFDVYEKMDGSLGIIFFYDGEWIVATRGSFTSPQANRAREILKKYDYEKLPKGWTTLCEIIYPENRIVCEYEYEELVMLCVKSNVSGIEYDYDSLRRISEETKFPVVKKYHGLEDFDKLKTSITDDREGYVIRFKNGLRIKIKGQEYVRLHRILTNISSRDIWEYLKDGRPLDELLDKVPDEFYNWVKETETNLRNQFNEISENVKKEFYELINRKEFAEKVRNNPLEHLLFTRLNSYSQKLDEMIWEKIYPPFVKPFKDDEI